VGVKDREPKKENGNLGGPIVNGETKSSKKRIGERS
jgi:hypothetical protein